MSYENKVSKILGKTFFSPSKMRFYGKPIFFKKGGEGKEVVLDQGEDIKYRQEGDAYGEPYASLKNGRRKMEEESKKIINDKVDGMLKEFEELLKKAMPIKQNAEVVNQVLCCELSDETKERVIEELLEKSKEMIGWSSQETTEDSEQNTTMPKS